MGAFGDSAAKPAASAAAPGGGAAPTAAASSAAGGGGNAGTTAPAAPAPETRGGADSEIPAGVFEGLSKLLDLEHKAKAEASSGDLYDISENDGRDGAPGAASGPGSSSGFSFAVPKVPEHSLRELAGDGRGKQLEIVAYLPNVSSGKEAALDVLPQRFSLVAGSKYRLRLGLPFAVDPDATKAKWDKKARSLRVHLLAAEAG